MPDPAVDGDDPTAHRRRRPTLEQVLAVVVIVGVAFLARFLPTIRGSGLFGINFYDDGVHYAAATGLVHGRVPYRDFLLLHPPGIVLALAPFAELARWIGDARGFALARVSFMALGAVNALLVSRYLRPVGSYAAWLGGLFYALFWPAIYSEHTVLLEGLANTCLLIALLFISPAVRAVKAGTAPLVVAGALLGFAATIKIWGVVPIVLVVGWLTISQGLRRAALLLAGAAGGTTVVCLPFFLAAPATMWRMVVIDQVQRNDTVFVLWERVNQMLGLSLYRLSPEVTTTGVVALVVLVGATIGAWTVPRARSAVILIVGLSALLLSTPSWFVHYTALIAAVLAIAVGAAGQQLVRIGAPRRRGLRIVVGGLTLAGLVAVSLPAATASIGDPFPGRTLGASVSSRPGCVVSDHPSTLILMSILSRNLDRDCPLVVDLGGASYHLDSPDRGITTRRRNEVFQIYALEYFRSGDTVILARFRRNFGLDSSSWKTVQSWPVVKRAGGYALRQPQPAR